MHCPGTTTDAVTAVNTPLHLISCTFAVHAFMDNCVLLAQIASRWIATAVVGKVPDTTMQTYVNPALTGSGLWPTRQNAGPSRR